MKHVRNVLFVILLLVLLSTSALAQQEKTRIGVWNFDAGELIPLDANVALSDVLRSELFLTGKFAVIERSDMDRTLQQRRFQQAECVSTECVVEAGRILGVEKMVSGTIGKVGVTYTINLRLIDVGTGNVERMAKETCRCEIDDLIYVVGAAAKALAESETRAERQARIERERIAKEEEEKKKAAEKKAREFTAEGMILIPAGKFLMGSPEDEGADVEHPQHTIYLDAFYIDKYEVTNAQFKEFVEAAHYVTQAERDGWGKVWTGKGWPKEKGANWKHPYGLESSIEDIMDHPVVQVSWNDANAYARWIGKRLPTEAEWEKAARGADGRKFPWGNAAPDGSRCNFADKNTDFEWSYKGANDKYKYTAPVGAYEAGKSPYGVYDMAGNVWEWCSDWYDKDYYIKSPTSNPAGPSYGTAHPTRGGAWSVNVDNLRAANRYYSAEADFRVNYLGFRLAHDAE
ncbi:SUMF1/EgtB/PvdO family nonheme iron enzyme [Candidatus Poribacteria bacterium]|nr:SUMF1/EgtB/PvdO family nonheme iron enzyme [Candidatus Poribacteria bacterium]